MAVTRFYQEGQGVAVLPPIFYVTRVNNPGAAFGMLKGNTPVLASISFVCVIWLCVLIIRDFFSKSDSDKKAASLVENVRTYALAFIVAGAAGNLYDRVFYGYVVDFLDFRVWPVFNVADTFICVGMFLIILSILKSRKVN